VGIALRLGMLMAVATAPTASAKLDAPQSDGVLEARAQAGDRTATGLLLKQHAPMLLGICQQIVGPGDARDALQESLERIVRQLARFDAREGTFRSWAGTVARNVCRGPDPERDAMASQGTQALAKALDGLPEEMRTALLMFHVHEASYEEIARALEVPMGTVMTWLHRGRKRLQAAVEER
jgi:RNA polymerase sigma-70 factor (ECF subfamily)